MKTGILAATIPFPTRSYHQAPGDRKQGWHGTNSLLGRVEAFPSHDRSSNNVRDAGV
jgi:hypothetical protein